MCGELLARRPAFERRRHAHTHTHTHKLKEYITTSTRKQDKKKGGKYINGRERGYTSSSSSNTRNIQTRRDNFFLFFLLLC
jgi:hypothetical protein